MGVPTQGPAYLDARGRGTRGAIDWTHVLANLETRFADARLQPPDLTGVADELRACGQQLAALLQTMGELRAVS